MDWRSSLPKASSAFNIEPASGSIRRTFYSCGKRFELEPLREILAADEEQRQIGVVLAHGRVTEAFVIAGATTRRLATVQTTVQKTHKKGGQSQARIGRLRDNKKKRNVSFVGESIEKHFLDHRGGRPTVYALLVGGSAETPAMVLNDLPPELQAIAVGQTTFAWPDTNADAFYAAMRDEVARFERARERSALQLLHDTMNCAPELLEYGAETIERNLHLLKHVFVDARAHPELAQREASDDLPANLSFVVIHVSDDLDAYGGCVAIRHM